MTIKDNHRYYYQIQQQLLTTRIKYNDFVVCSIKDSIEVVCRRKTGILYSLKSPVFGDFICCMNIQERWLTRKRHLILKQVVTALMKPAHYLPTTCLVLNPEECQRNGSALCVTKLPYTKAQKARRAVMAQLWEHSPPTNVARVRFPDSASYVGWVCWFSSLLWEVFPRVLRFFPLLKNLHLIKFDLYTTP